jgi:predicted nucleic acid-binding protein
MRAIVVDSSVVIKWFVMEPYSTDARRILARYQTGALTLLAPDLLNAEIGNIVWKKQIFHGLAAADARLILNAFRALTITFTSTAVLLDEAHHLAVNSRRSVYDMLYLALSLRENCPFVTADEKLVNAIRLDFPNVAWLKDWA